MFCCQLGVGKSLWPSTLKLKKEKVCLLQGDPRSRAERGFPALGEADQGWQ